MELNLNCGTCMLRLALSAMASHDIDESRQIEVMNLLIADIPKYLKQPTPSHFQSILIQKLSGYLGIRDIYAEERKRQNLTALGLVGNALKQIQRSDDPLYTSALLAVEGNMIDQIFAGHVDIDINAAIGNILQQRFVIDSFRSFVAKLEIAEKIVYITDNAGEIVFDRIFIDQCQNWKRMHGFSPAKVSIIVKSEPVLNDALMEDAIFTGMDSVGQIFESGSSLLGLPMGLIAPSVRAIVDDAGLIISKGQANFETLDNEEKLTSKIFFMLKTKCLHVSDAFGVPEGSSVFSFRAG